VNIGEDETLSDAGAISDGSSGLSSVERPSHGLRDVHRPLGLPKKEVIHVLKHSVGEVVLLRPSRREQFAELKN